MEQINEVKEQVTTRSIGVRYGLISGIISIAYFVVMNVAGVDMTQGVGRWASLPIYIVLIFLAQKAYKEQGDSFMSYGQGFGIGFWIALISSLLSCVFTYIYIKFIDLNYITQMMDKQRQAMEEAGNLSQQQIDQAMSITSRIMTPELIPVLGLVFGVIFLVIITLVITIFTQKKNPDPFVN